jgi:hypothetical protein
VGIATTGFCYPGEIRRVRDQLLHRPTSRFFVFASPSDFFDNSIGRGRPCSDLNYFDFSCNNVSNFAWFRVSQGEKHHRLQLLEIARGRCSRASPEQNQFPWRQWTAAEHLLPAISLEVDVTEEYQSRSVFYQKAEEPTNFYQKAKSRAV